ncbi:phosphoenolpyruvate-protein phosphotransferase [Reticulibacter mediterranei]|uniref:Phosphoenolpyruvate-protein phosphotransferase n=1 Tax=Reticulibacter mediterranei TaxID=2778369 RepID=A0A8J3ISM7_9CHLR|nr:phosphoenolpyruvate--protein phosphotransferase [Reticulibacter mediterranei]GHO99723.1 phosphoenolpyruvate-protein phosphotransferase [Reticulibacter mediterranei]
MSQELHAPIAPLPALAISAGVAIGPVHLFRRAPAPIEQSTIGSEQVEGELQRLQEALGHAIQELQTLSTHVAETVGRSEADIFEAQQLILEDPDLLEEVQALIAQQHYSAASALQQAAKRQADELELVDNEVLAARSTDIRDAVAHAIKYLTGTSQTWAAPTTPVIIVADDLTPSDTAKLDPRNVLGICTVTGGPTTHAAIIARTLEIPAIAGIDPALLDMLRDGELIAVDGSQGLLYQHIPTDLQQQLQATARQQWQDRSLTRLRAQAQWQQRRASTADGTAVQVSANVGDVESAHAAAESGAEGIGLLRTEFLFGGRSAFPDEQEQFESYLAVFRAFAQHAQLGQTIVARTLDAGADKPFPALEPLIGPLHEANPALGLRGARIHLIYDELLRQQLRALLLAGSEADIHLHIMFPMIATLEEVRRLINIYHETRAGLETAGIILRTDTQVGIMIETPSAVFMADALARVVDFFSIGANDLYQYTMAADRTNGRVTGMFGLLEPAVWRSIYRVVQAANQAGKLVAVCGELAADPRIAPLLAGLGVQELSMNPPAIVRVKAALHRRTIDYWQQRAHDLLLAETVTDALTIVETAEQE